MSVSITCTRCGQPMNATDRFCANCGTGNPMVTRPPDSGASGSVWEVVQESLRATTRGEFDIAGELGHGGMAAVYLAHDIALDKKVAIKVMAPSLMADPSMIGRFQDEARTVAKLEHPNIVTVHAARQAGGLYFFVMKYVLGRDLDSILESGPLPLGVTQAVLYQVASALQYAHGRNVIHRDIKPSNIMIDLEGNAVVMDFGIAKLRGSRGHTMVGAAIGTPPYMSPEQCLGKEVSPASDQYSLGMVAYHLLTGRPPFAGEPLPVMRQQIEVDPPPIESLKDGPCPPNVRDAVRRMLAKTEANRFGSVVEAARALGGHPLALDDPLRSEIARLAQSGGFIPPTQIFTTPLSPSPQVGWAPEPLPPTVPLSPLPMPPVAPPPSAPVSRPPTPAAATPLPPPPTAPVTPPPSVPLTPLPTAPIAQPPAAPVTPPPSAPLTPPPTAPIAQPPTAPVVPPPSAPLTPPPSAAPAPTQPARPPWTKPVSSPLDGVPPLAPPAVAATALVPSGGAQASGPAAPVETPRPVTVPTRPSTTPIGAVRPSRRRPLVIGGALVGVAAVVAVVLLAVRKSPESPSTPAEPPGGPPAAPRITPAQLTLGTGQEGSLSVEGLPVGTAVSWRSTDATVVTVGTDGRVHGVRAGEAFVIASAAGRADTAAVTVGAEPPRMARLEIRLPQAQVRVGDAITLSAAAFDQGNRQMQPEQVRWRSSNPSILAVTQAGTATARAPGSVTVIAAAAGGIEARADLSIVAVARNTDTTAAPPAPTRRVVTTVAIDPARIEMAVGETRSVTAEARDAQDRPMDRPISFRSENQQVATVSDRGTVRALAPGTALIVAVSDGIENRAMVQVRAAAVTPVRDTAPPPPATAAAVTFAGIAAGGGRTCAVASGSQAIWCWGNKVLQPASVTGSAGAVTVGADHACALTDGQATCWGSNAEGQLGTDARNATRYAIPAVRFQQLSAGEAYTCGATTAGQVLCWGKNDRGQLGDGSTSRRTEPTPIAADGRFTAVATGAQHSCALRADGAAVCWGNNWSGQVGSGMKQDLPRPTVVDGDAKFRQLAIGREHTCGVTVAGKVLCWGRNSAGQIGNGSTREQDAPAAVQASQSFTQVVAGREHTCALASDGHAFCWGRGKQGEIGDGANQDRQVPTAVRGGETFEALAAGDQHTCGVTRAGAVLCWGANVSGQLGSGGSQAASTPTPVKLR
jgi:serine/threonine protein kinase/uncharacterized protein YjdB